MRSSLVILPGWGHDAGSWEAFAERFQERKLRVLELPGFGREPLVSASWGVAEYAAWVDEQLSDEPPGSVVLLGHSFGGRVAAYLASSHPQWLSRLVLYGAPLLYRPDAQTRMRIAFAKFLKPVLQPIIPKAAYQSDELAWAEAHGMGTIFRNVVGFDQSTYLPRIEVPTLMLWGADDSEAPVPIARAAARLIPHALFLLLPGVGHNAHLERPELFYGTVAKFLVA
jgi:pimeloyl-ACP methyl ester carboxylesterase